MIRVVIVLVAALASASTVRAEPYVVGSNGSLTLDFEGDGFLFDGSGFAVYTLPNMSGNFGPYFTDGSPGFRCDPCRTGDVFDPSFRTNGEILLGDGAATFGGTTYARATLYGTLNFSATPLLFPASTSEGLVVQTPFSFTGTVRGLDGGTELFAAGFTGTGNVRRFFDRNEFTGAYGAGENHITFLFEGPAPAPVPEPATLLLFGSGLGAVLARSRSKAKAAPGPKSC
jgi:hypothetical protein